MPPMEGIVGAGVPPKVTDDGVLSSPPVPGFGVADEKELPELPDVAGAVPKVGAAFCFEGV